MHSPRSFDVAASAAPPRQGGKPWKSGLYLELFHGRRHPEEPLSGWGFDGPAIGPLKWVHTSYAIDIRIEFEDAAGGLVYFGVEECQFELTLTRGMLAFGGLYYGDWTVCWVGAPAESPHDPQHSPTSMDPRRTDRGIQPVLPASVRSVAQDEPADRTTGPAA